MPWTERRDLFFKGFSRLTLVLLLFFFEGCGPSGGGGEKKAVFDFQARRDFFAGKNPAWVVSSDLDRDGYLDCVASNPPSDALSVLFGQEGGSFALPVELGDIVQPEAIITAKLNSDLWPDLIAASPQANSFSVILAKGQGDFGSAVSNPIGAAPHHLASGDYNEDGSNDLVLAETLNGTLYLASGLGNGNFDLPGSRLDVGGNPTFVVMSQFDNLDDHLDLAVADEANGEIVLFRGDGAGNFTPVYRGGTGPQPCWIACGKLNTNDSHLDLAVACSGDGSVHVFLGSGSGSFTPSAIFAVGGSATSITTEDFDRDGILDLAWTDPQGPRIIVLRGKGDGISFQPPVEHPMGGAPFSILSGNVDQNSFPDLVVGDGDTYSRHISVFLNQGNGGFYDSLALAVEDQPSSIVVEDLDRDEEDSDTAVANYGSNSVTIFLRRTEGGVTVKGPHPVGTNPRAMISDDINSDFYPDLLVANEGSNDITLLLGSASWNSPQAKTFPAGPSPSDLVTGKFNGDMYRDLVVANSGDGTISLLLGQFGGEFGSPSTYAAGEQPIGLAAGLFDTDPFMDVAVLDGSSGRVFVLRGDGLGGFNPDASSFFAANGPLAITPVDADQDGYLDLAVSSASEGVVFLEGMGNGSFSKKDQALSVGAVPVDILAGNFNGDDFPDLATANFYEDSISILLGRGGWTFDVARTFGAGIHPSSLGAGDLMGNGSFPDFAVSDASSGQANFLFAFY